MGLDMYLSARKYVSGWESSYARTEADAKAGRKSVELFDSITEAMGLERSDINAELPSLTITVEVAYWRKANAIHDWFVENVQGGTDDCGKYSVDRDNLDLLVATLAHIMKAKEDGADEATFEELLPTSAGFFFGSTEYDEYYWEYIASTHKHIKALLENPKFDGFDFEYQSSW
jgi:hypothetical protein